MADQSPLILSAADAPGVHDPGRSPAGSHPSAPASADPSLLAAIVEGSDDAILSKDLDGTITSWNAGAERMYGYRAEEIVGRPISVLVPPEHQNDVPLLLARLLRGERIRHYETVRMARDGRRLTVSLTLSPLYDRSGRMVGASTTARDITHRVHEESRWRLLSEVGQALSQILDREEMLRELARLLVRDQADYCVTYLLEDGRIRRVGTAHADPTRLELVTRLTALAPPTLDDAFGAGAVMRTGEPILASEITPRMLELASGGGEYLRVLQELGPVSSIVLPLRARGRTVGALALALTSRSSRRYGGADLALAGELANRAGLILDNIRLYDAARAELRRRETAEASLRRRFGHLRVLYEMTDAVVRARGLEEIYGRALDGLRLGLGVERASILLSGADGVMRFEAWRGLSDGYRLAVEGHSPWTPDARDPVPIVVTDVEASHALDGALRAAVLAEGIRAMAFIPLVFGGKLLGKFMLYYGEPRSLDAEELELARAVAGTVAFAITRMRDDLSVREAKEAAERGSEAKSQFLGIMSHELRTPLNAVLGYAELLILEIRGPLNPDQRIQVERIRASARHQLELVEELLTYARVEAGREEPRLIETDVRRVVRDVAELVRPEADAKGLRLVVDLPEAPLTAVTDPARLRQIVLNLAANATKYTLEGEVAIRAGQAGTDLLLHVRDTGPGIPEDRLDYIFEPFTRVDESRTRLTSGTGLGLAIVRRLATLLGGEVRVRSRVGEGSVFSLKLPARSAP